MRHNLKTIDFQILPLFPIAIIDQAFAIEINSASSGIEAHNGLERGGFAYAISAKEGSYFVDGNIKSDAMQDMRLIDLYM